MDKIARDMMTPAPACCSPDATLEKIATLMVANDCGEIPVVDRSGRPIGVITDRDIVCRVVAEGKDPATVTAESMMSTPVVVVYDDAELDDVLDMMETHQIRRVPVIDAEGCCSGIIAQADLVSMGSPHVTSELLTEISRDNGHRPM
jgi:CBS domain-containing protein